MPHDTAGRVQKVGGVDFTTLPEIQAVIDIHEAGLLLLVAQENLIIRFAIVVNESIQPAADGVFEPGSKIQLLRSSGLNQTRGSVLTKGLAAWGWPTLKDCCTSQLPNEPWT